MSTIIAAVMAIVQTIVKELTGKVGEQLKLEDKVDETEGVLVKLEVIGDAERNADLLGDVGWMSDPDGDTLPEGDALV